MQAKLILIAASATVVISALVIGYATMFGSGASGNFKITGRQYFDVNDNTQGFEEVSASHLNGNVKFSYLRQGEQDDSRILLQVVGDVAYEYFYAPASGDRAAEYVLLSCVGVASAQGLGGISNVNEVSVTALDANTFLVANGEKEIFTIHFEGGKPATITRGVSITYTVTDWAQDAGEIVFAGALPPVNDQCDGKALLQVTDDADGARRLDATGFSSNQDHWWVQVIGFAKWGKEIGYGSGNVVNEGYIKKMGFKDATFIERSNAKGVFFTFSNNNGCGVSIAGTDDITDAVQDLNAIPTNCHGSGQCHSGFIAHYNQLKVDFENEFKARDCAGKKFIFAGHSLGGATALVMAEHYVRTGKVAAGNSIVHTAGNPRPFWNQTPNVGKVTRQINDMDPIPALPPSLGGWFSHPVAEVHAVGKYWVCTSRYWWGGCKSVGVRASYQTQWNDWTYTATSIGAYVPAAADSGAASATGGWACGYCAANAFTHLLSSYFDYHNAQSPWNNGAVGNGVN